MTAAPAVIAELARRIHARVWLSNMIVPPEVSWLPDIAALRIRLDGNVGRTSSRDAGGGRKVLLLVPEI
jgi:hypothetical protein